MVGLVVGLSYVCGVFLVYFYGDVQGDTGQWVWELGPGIGKGDLGLGMGRGLIACVGIWEVRAYRIWAFW